MGIWIRSQDKTSLAECKTIDIVKRVNDEYHIHANFMDFDYVFLGEYSSKEKAFAVLDMIQKHIATRSNNVFQMPQDIIIIDNNEVEV